MKTIGLVPMAAKPYHAGHDGLVRIAARENDEVHLFVSTTDRKRPGEMPIYGADMKQIWDKFLEPSLPSNVIVTYGGSPVGHLYEELEQAEAEGSEDTFQIYSDKEDILKYTDTTLSHVAPTLFENGQIVRRGVDRKETVNVSGTKMRAMLAAGDVKSFAAFLPPAVRRNASQIIRILTRRKNENSIFFKHDTIRSNMKSLLKEYVKEILSEELVTVTRGKLQLSYDVTFDEQDNIVKSKKVMLNPDEIGVLESVKKIAAAVPQGELLKKLRELKKAGVQLQAPAKSPQNVVKVMNAYWADTLDWPTVTRIGRGELQLRMAFEVNPDVPEPDFVSADGVSLSVKFLGNGSQTAKTGEANRTIPALTEQLAKALGIAKFPQGSFSGESLMTHLATLDPRKKAAAISKARAVLDKIKQSIVSEHDADGILMLDNTNGFYLVSAKNYQDVHPTSIRNSGTRLEFTGPKLSPGITTLERALDYSEAGGRPARVKKTASSAEPED